jgi:hypothetical protein
MASRSRQRGLGRALRLLPLRDGPRRNSQIAAEPGRGEGGPAGPLAVAHQRAARRDSPQGRRGEHEVDDLEEPAGAAWTRLAL